VIEKDAIRETSAEPLNQELSMIDEYAVKHYEHVSSRSFSARLKLLSVMEMTANS
jgi:hypothetical protein